MVWQRHNPTQTQFIIHREMQWTTAKPPRFQRLEGRWGLVENAVLKEQGRMQNHHNPIMEIVRLISNQMKVSAELSALNNGTSTGRWTVGFPQNIISLRHVAYYEQDYRIEETLTTQPIRDGIHGDDAITPTVKNVYFTDSPHFETPTSIGGCALQRIAANVTFSTWLAVEKSPRNSMILLGQVVWQFNTEVPYQLYQQRISAMDYGGMFNLNRVAAQRVLGPVALATVLDRNTNLGDGQRIPDLREGDPETDDYFRSCLYKGQKLLLEFRIDSENVGGGAASPIVPWNGPVAPPPDTVWVQDMPQVTNNTHAVQRTVSVSPRINLAGTR